MPDIHFIFPVNARPAKVFAAITTSTGLDVWWTKNSEAEPKPGGMYKLDFGPGWLWSGKLACFEIDKVFELEMISADEDWKGTRVGFNLEWNGKMTMVKFHHTGWPNRNTHFESSSFCWAMYLRIMKRYVEFGELVAYEDRLQV
jgi:uncharacterized protein YndB with AHSA1/START domain